MRYFLFRLLFRDKLDELIALSHWLSDYDAQMRDRAPVAADYHAVWTRSIQSLLKVLTL